MQAATVLHTYLQHNKHNISLMRLFEHLFTFIAPYNCLVCDTEGSIICSSCKSNLKTPPQACFICQTPSIQGKTCENCRKQTNLSHVWIAADNDETTKELLKLLKKDFSREAAKLMANIMASTLPLLPKNTLIIPVPAKNSSVRARSFDQSKLIAKELSKLVQRPYQGALVHVGKKDNQAFRLKKGAVIQGQKILLVDDTLSSGRTLQAAAKSLNDQKTAALAAIVYSRQV